MVSNLNLLESRRRILLNTPHIETISDTIASFKTDVSTKLKGCKIHFTPIQEGEGDPSPENVRPITGWDGVTVTACGKNLFDKSKRTTSRLIDSTGLIVNNSSWFVTDFIPLQGTKVSCHGSRRANITYHAFYDENKQLVSVVKQEQINNLTIPSKARYIRCSCANEYANAFQVELNSTPTSYEPYNSTTLTIPFPQTIYGGYVDLVKGEVVEEYSAANEFTKYRQNNGFIAYRTAIDSNNKNKFYCNMIGKIGSFSTSHMTQNIIQTDRVGGNLYFALDENADINSLQLVYPRNTPNTYSIDPQTLKTLRGINNIWSNANGNIEVSFYTH